MSLRDHEATKLSPSRSDPPRARPPQRMFSYDGPALAIDARIADVLHGSVGVSGWERRDRRGDVVEPLFCAPSSGNLRSVETYVVTPGGVLAHYEAVSRRFVECGRATCDVPSEGALVFLRVRAERQMERYGLRGRRYAWLDVGHAAFAVTHAASLLGVRTRRIGGSTVSIALDRPNAWMRWIASRPSFRRTATRREIETARPASAACPIEPVAGLEAVFGRRSAKTFDGAPLHGVELALTAGDVPLRRVHPKDDPIETAFACGAQTIAGDAAAVVAFAAPMPEGDEGYAAAHVLAGMRAQQVCVRAASRGIGARAIGGFFDDDAAEAFGVRGGMVLSCVALGRPSAVDDR